MGVVLFFLQDTGSQADRAFASQQAVTPPRPGLRGGAVLDSPKTAANMAALEIARTPPCRGDEFRARGDTEWGYSSPWEARAIGLGVLQRNPAFLISFKDYNKEGKEKKNLGHGIGC